MDIRKMMVRTCWVLTLVWLGVFLYTLAFAKLTKTQRTIWIILEIALLTLMWVGMYQANMYIFGCHWKCSPEYKMFSWDDGCMVLCPSSQRPKKTNLTKRKTKK